MVFFECPRTWWGPEGFADPPVLEATGALSCSSHETWRKSGFMQTQLAPKPNGLDHESVGTFDHGVRNARRCNTFATQEADAARHVVRTSGLFWTSPGWNPKGQGTSMDSGLQNLLVNPLLRSVLTSNPSASLSRHRCGALLDGPRRDSPRTASKRLRARGRGEGGGERGSLF